MEDNKTLTSFEKQFYFTLAIQEFNETQYRISQNKKWSICALPIFLCFAWWLQLPLIGRFGGILSGIVIYKKIHQKLYERLSVLAAVSRRLHYSLYDDNLKKETQ